MCDGRKLGEPSTHTCGRMDLRVTEDMLFCCSATLPSKTVIHPTHALTKTTHTCTGKHNFSPFAGENKQHHTPHAQMHSKHFPMISLHLAPHLPLSSSASPYHPVRSRRWFFGCSCTAHCSQASAPVCSSPPSLHRPVRRCLYSFPCSSIIQAFARTHACMRAHVKTLTYTHRKSADAQGRAAGARAALFSAGIRRRLQIRLM